MILKYRGRDLFVGPMLLSFDSEVQKAQVYKGQTVVFASRLIFHDVTSFSTSIYSNFFVRDRIYYQEGGVYSVTGPYDTPRLEFVTSYLLVEVTSKHFVLGHAGRYVLKSENEEVTLCIRQGMKGAMIEKTGARSTHASEACLAHDSQSFGSLENEVKVMYLNRCLVFAKGNEMLFVDDDLEVTYHCLATSLYFAGVVKVDQKMYTAINDKVFSGAEMCRRYVIASGTAITQNYYEMTCKDEQLVDNPVKKLCFVKDERDAYLLDGAGQTNRMAGESVKFALRAENVFAKKLLELYPFGCTQDHLAALFETEMLRRRSPTTFIRDNLETIKPLSDAYYTKLKRFLDENDKTSDVSVSSQTSGNEAPPNTLNGYLMQVHRSRMEKHRDGRGALDEINMRETYTIKKEFANYIPVFQTPKLVRPRIAVKSDDPPIFKLDEADLENRREKAYFLRRMTLSSLPLLNLYAPSVNFQPLSLRVKRDSTEQFKVPYKDWDRNLRFNYGVCAVLIRNIKSEILLTNEYKTSVLTSTLGKSVENDDMHDDDARQHPSSEEKREDVASSNTREPELAGNVFAMGLLGWIEAPPVLHSEFGDFVSQVSVSFVTKSNYALIPLPDVLLKRTAHIIGLGFSFRHTRNRFVANILRTECSRFGNCNKLWVDELYRMCAGLSLYLVGDKWVSCDDKLVEVVYNGLTFFNTRNTFVVKKLRRTGRDRLEEVFYSSFFSRGVMGCVEDVRDFAAGMDLPDIYRRAGEYFYIGVSAVVLHRTPARADICGSAVGEQRARDMVALCLRAEEEMEKDTNYKFLFDMLLISVSLVHHGTSNLDVMRIVRRQLLKIEKFKNLGKIIDFVDGRYEIQYGLRYGDYLRYKVCMGVLFARIEQDSLFEIVSSFYISFPLCTADQKCFQIYRHLLATKVEKIKRSVYNNVGLDIEGEEAGLETDARDTKVFFDSFCKYIEQHGADEETDLAAFGLRRDVSDDLFAG